MAAPKKTPKKRKPTKKPAKKRKPASAAEFLAGLPKAPKAEDTPFKALSDSIFMQVRERLPSGVLALEKLTDGGWPVGAVVEVAAWEGVGKSTLLDQSMAAVQRIDGTSAIIDTEGARDLRYMEMLGVDPKRIVHVSAYTIEEVFERIDELLNRQQELLKTRPLAPLFIVWDSVGGTPAKAEREGAPDDKHMAVAAKGIKLNLRRIMLRLPEVRTCLVFTNHFYKEMGPFGRLVTPGGSGIRYFTHLRIQLRRTKPIKRGDVMIGHEVECKVTKTRLGPMPQPTTAGLIHGSGFDNSYTLFNWALEQGAGEGHTYLAKHGAMYHVHEPGQEPLSFKGGFAGFGDLLQSRLDLYQMLAARYLAS